jgi:hypothetical protein
MFLAALFEADHGLALGDIKPELEKVTKFDENMFGPVYI